MSFFKKQKSDLLSAEDLYNKTNHIRLKKEQEQLKREYSDCVKRINTAANKGETSVMCYFNHDLIKKLNDLGYYTETAPVYINGDKYLYVSFDVDSRKNIETN